MILYIEIKKPKYTYKKYSASKHLMGLMSYPGTLLLITLPPPTLPQSSQSAWHWAPHPQFPLSADYLLDTPVPINAPKDNDVIWLQSFYTLSYIHLWSASLYLPLPADLCRISKLFVSTRRRVISIVLICRWLVGRFEAWRWWSTKYLKVAFWGTRSCHLWEISSNHTQETTLSFIQYRCLYHMHTSTLMSTPGPPIF